MEDDQDEAFDLMQNVTGAVLGAKERVLELSNSTTRWASSKMNKVREETDGFIDEAAALATDARPSTTPPNAPRTLVLGNCIT